MIVPMQFPPHRWHEMFSMLSMDVVSPFYDMMGLQHFKDLPQLLRTHIVAQRKTIASAGSPVPAPEEMLAAVKSALGGERGRYWVWWAKHVFHWDPQDHRPFEDWRSVIGEARKKPELSRRLFPKQFADEAMAKFKQASDLKDYRRLQETVDARPLSDWDLHLYAIRLYDDNLYPDRVLGTVPDGPRLYLDSTIGAQRSYEFWAWVLKTLRPQELEWLLQEAVLIAKEEELSWVKELPHPSTFEVRP